MTEPTLQHFAQVIHHGDQDSKRQFNAPGHCTLVDAGPGDLRASQAFIEKLIIMAVHEGQQVVHPKGGDPFAAGGTDTEILHLQMSGVNAGIEKHGLLTLKMSQNRHKLRQSTGT